MFSCVRYCTSHYKHRCSRGEIECSNLDILYYIKDRHMQGGGVIILTVSLPVT